MNTHKRVSKIKISLKLFGIVLSKNLGFHSFCFGYCNTAVAVLFYFTGSLQLGSQICLFFSARKFNILSIAHAPAVYSDLTYMAVKFFSQSFLSKSYHIFCLNIFSSHKR